ncbi:MAG: pilus assembly protein N-terminal domain-containing protein [Anaerolineae bacterium]|nr:pilus assembly protein N-terminal domain-containing protein [Anaerolineae bacterium]
MGFDSGFYDVQQARRFRQSILLFIILATLPCYCVGAILLGVAPNDNTSEADPTNTLPAPAIQTQQARTSQAPAAPSTVTLFPTQNQGPLQSTPGQFVPATSTPLRFAPTLTVAPTFTLFPSATPTTTATTTSASSPTPTNTATQAANQNPAFTAPPVDITLEVGGSTTVAFSFVDPDGDPVSFTASPTNPAIASVTSFGPSSFDVQALAAGTTSITVLLQDNRGGSATTSINVTVNAPPATNQNPTFTIEPSPMTIPAGDSQPVFLQFSDPDGNTVTYTATSADTGVAAVTIVDGTSFMIQGIAAGDTSVTVTLSDGNGGSALRNIAITVN